MVYIKMTIIFSRVDIFCFNQEPFDTEEKEYGKDFSQEDHLLSMIMSYTSILYQVASLSKQGYL